MPFESALAFLWWSRWLGGCFLVGGDKVDTLRVRDGVHVVHDVVGHEEDAHQVVHEPNQLDPLRQGQSARNPVAGEQVGAATDDSTLDQIQPSR